jgi:hypothetical protein
MRTLLIVMLIAAAAVNGFAAPETKPDLKEVKAGPLTETDKDGYILFTYSLADGLGVQAGGKDPTIKVVEEKGGTTFVFENHVLSCGTVMNGRITMSKNNSMTKYAGAFKVSNNSYKIDVLAGDYSKDSVSGKSNGSLTVNKRKIDITLF